ncbi:MAG: 6,7-dimethyl-8-ribityllumazine synthase [Lautropia sp.]|nr:6,7-dimethyl-8-ribityllumazine synthase [Lautropia sp.]
MSVDRITGSLQGEGLRIGIVQARFNEEFGKTSLDACLAELQKLGVAEADTLVCTVPGALEVPLVLLQLANSGQFDALIAIGTIIKGETYHFEVVCNESARGISQVGLELGIPVANAILTTYTEEQTRQRAAEKGAEAARVAVEMATLSGMLDTLAGDGIEE